MIEDERWRDRVHADIGILSGKPVIRGTRVPAYLLVGQLAGGALIPEIAESYGISPEDIQAALEYAAYASRFWHG